MEITTCFLQNSETGSDSDRYHPSRETMKYIAMFAITSLGTCYIITVSTLMVLYALKGRTIMYFEYMFKAIIICLIMENSENGVT